MEKAIFCVRGKRATAVSCQLKSHESYVYLPFSGFSLISTSCVKFNHRKMLWCHVLLENKKNTCRWQIARKFQNTCFLAVDFVSKNIILRVDGFWLIKGKLNIFFYIKFPNLCFCTCQNFILIFFAILILQLFKKHAIEKKN